jgi:hypothetical protein
MKEPRMSLDSKTTNFVVIRKFNNMEMTDADKRQTVHVTLGLGTAYDAPGEPMHPESYGLVISRPPAGTFAPTNDQPWVVSDRVTGAYVGIGGTRAAAITDAMAKLVKHAEAHQCDIPTLLTFARAENTHGIGHA